MGPNCSTRLRISSGVFLTIHFDQFPPASIRENRPRQAGEETVDEVKNRKRVFGMKLADLPALKRLSAGQRMSLAQELWDSAASDTLLVPESHKKLIRARRVAYEGGRVRTLTMGELAKAIHRRT